MFVGKAIPRTQLQLCFNGKICNEQFTALATTSKLHTVQLALGNPKLGWAGRRHSKCAPHLDMPKNDVED